MFWNFNSTKLFKFLLQSFLALHNIRGRPILNQIYCKLSRLLHLFYQGFHFLFSRVDPLKYWHVCCHEGLDCFSLALSNLCDNFFGYSRDLSLSCCNVPFQRRNCFLKLLDDFTKLTFLVPHQFSTTHDVILFFESCFVEQNNFVVLIIRNYANLANANLTLQAKKSCDFSLVELLWTKRLSL